MKKIRNNERAAKSCRKLFVSRFYYKNKLTFGVALSACLLLVFVNLAAAWLIQQFIDTISQVTGARSLEELITTTIVFIMLILVFGMLVYVSRPRFMKKAMKQYKEYVFEALTKKSINSFQKEATATYISALSNDTNSIEENYLHKQFELIENIIMFIGAFAMMLLYSPLLTLIAVLLTLLPIVASLLVGNRMESMERQVSDKNASFVDTLKESLYGFSVIKSFKAEKAITALFLEKNEDVEEAKCNKRKIGALIDLIGAVTGIMAQLGVFIAGAYLATTSDKITAGVVIAFVNLMNYVIMPIGTIPTIWAERKAALSLIDKLAEVLDTNVYSGGTEVPAKFEKEIEMKNVSFAYAEGEEVLRDINLKFEAGKSYALVGASGSGKSTILNLLMGAYQNYEGAICYDGQELRDVSSESLYDIASVVQQNVFVFNASVRDNITMFREIEKEKVDKAIELSGLSSFMEEKGEDYLCGENGNALSGGEKQRISIARCLLRRADLLLIDEATAALDAPTAYQVSNSILDLEQITRIVITHSLDEALLRRYDEVIVLKSGGITEKGSFRELMEKKGYFYSLYTVSQ